jgi:hypothetical protein
MFGPIIVDLAAAIHFRRELLPVTINLLTISVSPALGLRRHHLYPPPV